jgi:hypothetical protein
MHQVRLLLPNFNAQWKSLAPHISFGARGSAATPVTSISLEVVERQVASVYDAPLEIIRLNLFDLIVVDISIL